MDGMVIIGLTLLFIVLAVFLIQFSFWLLEQLTEFYKESGHALWKIVLFIPWVALAFWCLFLQIFLLLLALFGVYSIAKTGRNWWHKKE